ncbi:hypothetical protein Tco_1569101 [Tanacetum coccineum]
MPKYAKFLKGLITNKARLEEACTITMNERCSTVSLNKLPSKEKDRWSFTIPYDIGRSMRYKTRDTLVEITSDEELEGPMKDQPLSADASPTALSPGYIANSDPEEDKEDPEEDPADHPADG